MKANRLDPSQLRFVESPARNIRLLAPAGCGKTLSLLFRCLHLSKQSTGARSRFLIVTFTVAAKAELLARLNEDTRFSTIRDQIVVNTLNSFGYTRIKNAVSNHKLLSSKEDYHFTALNQLRPVWMSHPSVSEAMTGKRKNSLPKDVMKIIDGFKSLGFDHIRHSDEKKFLARISELREQGLSSRLQEMVDDLTKAEILEPKILKTGEEVAQASDRELYSKFFRFWREATVLLIKSATFTIEDQKYFAYIDERGKFEEGKFLSGAAAFDHVLVDEFQDINPLDLALIKAIADRNKSSLTIVGDDDQAIFEWRGASPEYILKPDRYLDRKFETFILGVNYRSPKNIVEKSQYLISNNLRRVQKEVSAFRNDNATIETFETESLVQSLKMVMNIINKTITNNVSPAKVAIIGRKRSQIIPYQIYLASKGISFCAAEDLQVFLSKAFDKLLHLLVIRTKRTEKRMVSEVVQDTLELCDLIKRYPLNREDRKQVNNFLINKMPRTIYEAALSIAHYRGPLKGANQNGTMSYSLSDAILSFIEAKSASDTLLMLAKHFEGLQIDMGKAEDDVFYVDPPFVQLAEYAEQYSDFDTFIYDIERAKTQLVHVPPFEDDGENASQEELRKRPVQLMTALRAKGKEFDTVILLDVNDGIWPNKNSKSVEQKEAERRVFYVAFTRAKNRVVMFVSSRSGNRTAVPSPYLIELDGV